MSAQGSSDARQFQNISATTAQFSLFGGKYGITYAATWGGGTVTLQILGADGTTWIQAIGAFAANGYATADLPPGRYRFAVVTASAIYLAIARVPEN